LERACGRYRRKRYYFNRVFQEFGPHRASVTEITAAIYGVRHYFPDAQVIVDIGGQDTKVIDIKKNNFTINDKCSAGTGAFLEFVANYFKIGLKELGSLHGMAKRVPAINNTCGVFALSEMISQLVRVLKRRSYSRDALCICAADIIYDT